MTLFLDSQDHIFIHHQLSLCAFCVCELLSSVKLNKYGVSPPLSAGPLISFNDFSPRAGFSRFLLAPKGRKIPAAISSLHF